jgi:hypothetical protein
MGSTVTVISAVAASAAAALAAVNLIVSGRREHIKWARDALIEILSSFVDVSFESKDVVKRAIRRHNLGSWPLDADAEVRVAAREAERQMRRLQSRLRLLASPEVIDAAQRLRLAVREYHTLLDADHEVAVASDAAMRRDLWYIRQDFIHDVARGGDGEPTVKITTATATVTATAARPRRQP